MQNTFVNTYALKARIFPFHPYGHGAINCGLWSYVPEYVTNYITRLYPKVNLPRLYLLVSRCALNWLAHSSLRTQKSLVSSRIRKCCLCWQLPRVRPPERLRRTKFKLRYGAGGVHIVNKVRRNEIDEIIDFDWLLGDVPWFLGRIIPLCFFPLSPSLRNTIVQQMQPFDDPLTTKQRAHGYWLVVHSQLSSRIRPRPLAGIAV